MIVKWIIRPEWRGADKPDRIVLTADCCFSVDGVEYWIPAGYEIDGASVPKILWLIAGTPFEPDNAEPAFPHDAIYLIHAFTRSEADEILYQLKLAHELMIGTGKKLARYRAWKMWAGVRVAGFNAWKNNKEDLIEIAKMQNIIIARNDFMKFKTLWMNKYNV